MRSEFPSTYRRIILQQVTSRVDSFPTLLLSDRLPLFRARPNSGFFLLVLLAFVGYGLVALPPRLIEGYNNAVGHSPIAAYLYLTTVMAGGGILLGLLGWLALRVWKNTRRRTRHDKRRGLSPSEMSQRQQSQEVLENLTEGKNYAASVISPEFRAEIENAITELEAKRETEKLEIVAFGTISCGKSSVLNALAGREAFRTDVIGGTTVARSEIPWPAGDQVVLADTPGLAEVRGETRATIAAAVARNADLVLFVVDGPLKDYEHELLEILVAMEKRIVICLNKADWYDPQQQADLLDQIVEQVSPAVVSEDVVAIHSRPVARKRMRVLAHGGEQEETYYEPPDIEPLAQRLLAIVAQDGRELLLANLLLQSRGLVDEAKERVLDRLDQYAEKVIGKYMWAAGGAAAVNPIPILDIAGGTAVTVKMVFDLAGVYKQSIDADTVVTILAELGKNLLTMVGVSAATPALAAGVGALLKTVPGVGTIAGGLIQGLVQALVTRWIGRVFMAYFREGMQPPPGGLAEVAREKWAEVTSPEELLKLVQRGRQQLRREEQTQPSS